MFTTSVLHHLALVSETDQVQFSELARVAAALQKQVSRDVAPVWGVNATVDAFAQLEDVPIDYWPIMVLDKVDGAEGIHLDEDGHPFALAKASAGWSLTASHETIEMLCDPFGNEMRAGPSPKPGQHRVRFLVEPCDPSESEEFAYSVNGVLVSDFYTPSYFDPKEATGTRYSFTGAIKRPRQVLPGGYLSWHDPVTDHWFQEIFFGKEPAFRDIGRITQAEGSIRREVYKRTPEAFQLRKPQGEMALRASGNIGSATDAGAPRAQKLRSHIGRLLAEK